MQHFVVGIQHHNGTRSYANQRAASDLDAVIIQEFTTAHQRQGLHVIQAFGTAETHLRERQIG